MKKNYIAPQTGSLRYQMEGMIASSITNIGGNSGIGLADPTDEIPADADVKGNPFGESIFD